MLSGNQSQKQRLDAKDRSSKTGTDSDTQIRTQFLKNLYEGFYLLDLEYQNQKSETEVSATDLYIASYAKADETDRWESQEQLEQVTNDEVLSVMDEWSSQFEKSVPRLIIASWNPKMEVN